MPRRIGLAERGPRCSPRVPGSCLAYQPVRGGLWLGRRLRSIRPHEAFQRKPERGHDQAEDDDRQHCEGQAHHHPCPGQAACWPGQRTGCRWAAVGGRRTASPLAALGSPGIEAPTSSGWPADILQLPSGYLPPPQVPRTLRQWFDPTVAAAPGGYVRRSSVLPDGRFPRAADQGKLPADQIKGPSAEGRSS
jgi:hypothetical protein